MLSKFARWLTTFFSWTVEALGLFQVFKWLHKLLGYGEHIEFLTHLPGHVGRAFIVIETGLDKYPILGLLLVAVGLFLIWLRPRNLPSNSDESSEPGKPGWIIPAVTGSFRAVLRITAIGWPLIVGCAVIAGVYLFSDDDDVPTGSVASKEPTSTIAGPPPTPEPPLPQVRPIPCEIVSEKPEELPWTYANRSRYLGKCVRVSHLIAETEVKEVLPGDRKQYLVSKLQAPWAAYLILEPTKWQASVRKGSRFDGVCKIGYYFGQEERRGNYTLVPVYLIDCQPS
jgi:hypothetical protein